MSIRISLLALISMAGFFGLLVSTGVWDAVYFILAALPLFLGGGFVIFRKVLLIIRPG